MVHGLVSLEDLSTKEGYWWSGGAWSQTSKNTNSVLCQKNLTFTGPQLLGLKVSKHTQFSPVLNMFGFSLGIRSLAPYCLQGLTIIAGLFPSSSAQRAFIQWLFSEHAHTHQYHHQLLSPSGSHHRALSQAGLTPHMKNYCPTRQALTFRDILCVFLTRQVQGKGLKIHQSAGMYKGTPLKFSGKGGKCEFLCSWIMHWNVIR